MLTATEEFVLTGTFAVIAKQRGMPIEVEGEPSGRELRKSAHPNDQTGGVRAADLLTGWDLSTAALPGGSADITTTTKQFETVCRAMFLMYITYTAFLLSFSIDFTIFATGFDICILAKTHLSRNEPARVLPGSRNETK